MIFKRSKILRGVYYSSRNITMDMKGTRLVRYSWLAFLDIGITDVFETIYRKEILHAQELHGLFYYPERTFLLCCLNGGGKLLAVDLRPKSVSFLKCIKVSFNENGVSQVYLPIGVAWGILSEEEDTTIQIQATKGNGKDGVMIDPLSSELDFGWKAEEFLVAKYDLQVKKVEDLSALDTE